MTVPVMNHVIPPDYGNELYPDKFIGASLEGAAYLEPVFIEDDKEIVYNKIPLNLREVIKHLEDDLT